MKKLKKLSLKKEIEREAEALEKEVSGRKDLDHITCLLYTSPSPRD